jgi:hypothetical protein
MRIAAAASVTTSALRALAVGVAGFIAARRRFCNSWEDFVLDDSDQIVLARAVDDAGLSDEILDAVSASIDATIV